MIQAPYAYVMESSTPPNNGRQYLITLTDLHGQPGLQIPFSSMQGLAPYLQRIGKTTQLLYRTSPNSDGKNWRGLSESTQSQVPRELARQHDELVRMIRASRN